MIRFRQYVASGRARAIDAQVGCLDPLTHLRSALLALALILALLFVALLHSFPNPTHVVRLNLHKELSPAPVHLVTIDRHGEVSLDGARCRDLLDLRNGLDQHMQEPLEPQMWLEPDSHTRYEDVVLVITVMAQARALPRRLKVDPPSSPPHPAKATRGYCSLRLKVLPLE